MPWNPSEAEPMQPDQRLDPYRARGAVVTDENHQEVMRIYAQPHYHWNHLGGHLWWRRWSEPREMVVLHALMADGTYTDHWILGSELDDDLSDWAHNRFRYLGREYDLAWMDKGQSDSFRATLGLDETE